MDHIVVSCRIIPHQIHRIQVLLTFLAIQTQPSQRLELLESGRKMLFGQSMIAVAYRSTSPPAPTVAHKCDILTSIKTKVWLVQVYHTPLHKMIATTGRT